MSESVSRLAPASFPDIPPIAGVQLATYAAGIKYESRPDLFLASLAEGTSVAAAFTSSKCPSAPVEWCRRILNQGNRTARALVCNSGNANAFTGAAGTASATLTAEVVARSLGVDAERVFLASTGVIGEPLPDDILSDSLPALVDNLGVASAEAWVEAAGAICTTDTFSKGSAARINSTAAHIAGIAKGSGMIAPDMATMLAFVFTDLAVAPEILQSCLSTSVAASFNCITVDSDTSTSDTVLLFATGEQIDDEISSPTDSRLDEFQGALDSVLLDLAHQVVRDGEGATKFVQVTVTGAESDESAHNIARSIAESPLVSTALAAEDANWGRIVMAVGKAGERADRDRLSIWIGDELVAAGGAQHRDYSEPRATQHLKQDEIELRVDVGIGTGAATVWTCDLTHGYIEINAGYRS
ncbi:MAG: bifunctional glutamate N-acetyltransferase/amino-acid acetyltransferase ArgJ [Acidimicrobiaceae bacterium]|nr:bifunctional glutamate N-acetyltransferase/amino-acid acetyltransferase ArgJ [Acidimicrobiaceae bacterium]